MVKKEILAWLVHKARKELEVPLVPLGRKAILAIQVL